MAENSNNNKNEKLESDPLQEVKYIPTSKEDDQKLHPEQNVKRSDTIYLIFSVITGMLPMLTGGSLIVWPSPVVVKLKCDDLQVNPLGRPITTFEISMLTGMPTFTAVIGSIFLIKLADKIGRKMSLQILGLGMFLTITGLAFSNTMSLMVSFYSSFGIFFVGSIGIMSIYLMEICEDHNRAKYGCIMTGLFPMGQLITYIIGPLFNITYLSFLLSIPLILFQIFVFFAPESPVYYLSKGKKEECIKVLKKLRSNKTNSEINIDFYKISQGLSANKDKKKNNFFTIFKSKEVRIGMLIALIPLCAQFMCGVPIIMPLMAPIFNDANISISGSTVAILVGLLKFLTFIFTALIIEKTGRKPMLLISSAGASIPAFLLGLFFYLKHIDSPLKNHIQWLPVPSVLLFIFIYSFGLGPLPNAIMGEYFPSDVRSSAVSFMMGVSGLFLAAYSFIFPIFAETVGMHWCMWIFSITGIATAVLIYLIIPETKGKSVHEIQEILKNY